MSLTVNSFTVLSEAIMPGIKDYFTKKMIAGIPAPLLSNFSFDPSKYLNSLINTSNSLTKLKGPKIPKEVITYIKGDNTSDFEDNKNFLSTDLLNNKNDYDEEKSDSEKNIGDQLFNLLSTFAESVIQLLSIYVPIDTGLLLSSFYQRTGETEIILGFDLTKCPYATIVHETTDVRHPNGGISKFLYQAVMDTMQQYEWARYINVEFIINRQKLEVILNGKNSNLNQLFNKEDYQGPYYRQESLIDSANQFKSLNFRNTAEQLAFARRYEAQREILTGKKNVFMQNVTGSSNYSKHLSPEHKRQADLMAFRAVDTSGAFSDDKINDPRRWIFNILGGEVNFHKPDTFKAMSNFNQ